MSEAERHRALLDERSAALAARGLVERRTGAGAAYLVCAVGGERYGFPLSAAAAVLPERICTPVPGAPAALRGVVAEAGIVVSVIDLALALGLESGARAAGSGHLLRLRGDDPPIALAVDRVIGLAGLDDGIAPLPSADGGAGLGAAAVSGYAAAGSDRDGAANGGFAILDVATLLRPFLP